MTHAVSYEAGQLPDSVCRGVVKRGQVTRRCLWCGGLTTYVTTGFVAVVAVCSNSCHKELEIIELRGKIK
jgi:hypothetical protein